MAEKREPSPPPLLNEEQEGVAWGRRRREGKGEWQGEKRETAEGGQEGGSGVRLSQLRQEEVRGEKEDQWRQRRYTGQRAGGKAEGEGRVRAGRQNPGAPGLIWGVSACR